jgi:hypothetical protein
MDGCGQNCRIELRCARQNLHGSSGHANDLEKIRDNMTTAFGVNLIQRIGNTPLLRLDAIVGGLKDVQVLAKAEWTNPGGSVKDRAASNIVNEALRASKLGAGKTLLDATSGNIGIAYAMLGAAYGIPITLCVPSNVSAERKRILRAYGATVFYTDPGRRFGWSYPEGARDRDRGAGEVLLRRSVFQRSQLASALSKRNRG